MAVATRLGGFFDHGNDGLLFATLFFDDTVDASFGEGESVGDLERDRILGVPSLGIFIYYGFIIDTLKLTRCQHIIIRLGNSLCDSNCETYPRRIGQGLKRGPFTRLARTPLSLD